MGAKKTRPLAPFITSRTHFCILTAMSAILDDGLRHRVPHQREGQAHTTQDDDPTRDPIVLGKTPSGQGEHGTDFRPLTR
jgi:hypothetical protein